MGAADSKLAFKKGVFRLFEERNIPAAANDYWEQFWTLPESVDDIFLLVESQDIRRVRDEAPENLECLIEKILGRLFELCESREFLKPQAVAIQVLNCVRVLTRIFPFVFESEALRDWEELYFWPNTIPTEKRADSSEQSIVPEVVTAMNVETQLADKARSRHGQCTIEEFPEPAESAPLQGSRLIKTLLDLLFTSGFTLPTALETKTGVSYVIWETGIGSSKPIGTSKDLDDNRTEILRLLLVLFSRSMYIPPSVITTTDNPWIDAVVTGSDRQTTLAILCSLVNSALKYNPSRWGLPYNHVVLNDQRELLVMLCLQIIVVLLDYQVIAKVHSVSGNTVGRSGEHLTSADSVPTAPPPTPFPGMECESTSKNQFRYYLSRLHREQDFTFLTDGMCRILSIPMAASSTYLPGSTKQVKCHLETLTLCWKTVEINKRFRNYLLQTNRVLDIVVILLYFSLEYKQDSSHIGLVRMCACMLQTLSKDKAFGNSLNTPFEGHASLPVNVRIPNFHGTYGDYLICSVDHLVATTKRTLRCLYPALISTLFNVSPYIKNLSYMASSRLLHLTTSFASPSFLLAEETNHELLGVLLDTLCSILYYQGSDNPCLIYSLVQCESKIQTMAQFTLKQGLDGIHRLRYQRLEASSSAIPTDRSELKADNACHCRPAASGQHFYQGSCGESSQQYLWQAHSLACDNSTATENSNARVYPKSSLNTPLASPSSMPSSSPFCSSNQTESAMMPVLVRPDSTDSALTPPSDGCGHEWDVEGERGRSTVRRNSKDQPFHGISEKLQGKLPEKSDQSFSVTVQEESSCDLEREAVEFNDVKYAYNFSKRATSSRRPPLSFCISSNFQQEQITTAHDVGQNGFVPTDDWVQGWMGALRFDPMLILLRYVIPEIESIRATNEQQVLEHIRTSIIPVLHQVLPESGRPPILVHEFVWGELVVWFQELLWSQIYVGGGGRLGRQGLGAWFETGVKLFCVRAMSTSISTTAALTDSTASVAAATFQMAGPALVASSSPSPEYPLYHNCSISESSSGTTGCSLELLQ